MRKVDPQKEDRQQLRVTVALTAAALLAVAWLALVSIHSSDDFWYSTFFDHGLRGYFRLMREHYLTFNGRVLVHVVAQILLYLGSWSYALTCAGLCLWMPLSVALAEGRSPGGRWMTVALFAIGLLIMPLSMVREGMFWLSAFCNYVLPTAMICGELFLLRRLAEGGKCSLKAGVLLCVYAFCCGATTEQSGVVAVLVLVYYFLSALVKGRLRTAMLLQLLCGAAGLWTIFLSPATRERAATETKEGAVFVSRDLLVWRFGQGADLLAENWATILLLALVLLLVGVLAGQKWGKKWPALCGGLLAGVAVAAFLTGQKRFWLFVGLFALLLVSAVILLLLGRETTAGLLLCAVVSVVVMLPTASVAGRTLLPFYLYLLAVATLLAGEMLQRFPKPLRLGLPLISAVLAGAMLVPVVTGFWYNYRLDLQNRQAARAAAVSGELWYCMDYDMRYTWRKPFSDGYFYHTYLDSVGLGDNVKVYFFSEEKPNVYVDGGHVGFPALPQEDGTLLLPLRGILEALGGSIEMLDDEHLIVTLEGGVYTLDYPTLETARLTWTTAEGDFRELLVEKSIGYSSMCMEESLFSQGFGLTVVQKDAHRVEVSGRG